MHKKIKSLLLVFMILVLTIVPLSTAFAGTGVTPRPATEYVKPGDSYSVKSGNITVSGTNNGIGGNLRVRHGCRANSFSGYLTLSNCQKISSDFTTTAHVCLRIPPGQANNTLYIAAKYSSDWSFWNATIEDHAGTKYACADLPLWAGLNLSVYLVAQK